MSRGRILAGVILTAVVVAGCGGRAGGPTAPAGGNASSHKENGASVAAPAAPSSGAPSTPSSGGKYAVVAESSTASYAVREKLLEMQLNGTAVGKTSAITGEIVLEDGVIRPSAVQVDLSTLKSDKSRRDNRVREALDTGTHRFATYRITGAEGNPVLREGQEVALRLLGNMTIKGTERPLAFDATARLEGGTLTLTATTTFKMTEFGVTPPNIAGFVSVDDNVRVDVTLVARRS